LERYGGKRTRKIVQRVFIRCPLLQLHCNVPGLPDNRAEVTYLGCVAYDVNVLALFGNGCGLVAYGKDYAVSRNVNLLAVLGCNRNAVLADFGCLDSR